METVFRVGIAIFAGEPFLQCPLTTDRAILAHLLDGVTPYAVNQSQSAGTALGDALLFGVDYLARHRVESAEGPRDQAVVLITDGDSNQGLDPIVAARYAREEAVAVHLIGIGGPEPVEVFFEGKPVGGGDSPYLAVLDDAALSAVAAAADGRYYRALDGDALDDVFAELSRLESAPLEKRVVEHRRFATSWLALGLFPLFVGYVGLVGFVLRRPLR